MNIIPAVNGICEATEGTYRLPCEWKRFPYPEAGEVFLKRLSKLGDYRLNEDAEPCIRFINTEDMPAEAYRLDIGTDGITVEASGEQGAGLALTTLYQLAAEGKGEVPCVRIKDQPRFGWRGFHLDCCRHFFTVEEIKKIIAQAALLKMNRFHWHLSDDQGYRIESKVFPELNRIGAYRKLARLDPAVLQMGYKPQEVYGGYYTQDEIREVVSFAVMRGVEVIPEIDLPGHCSAILAAFPQLTCSGEPVRVQNTFGVHSRIFCAGKPETYEFLYRLLDEIFTLFPSEYVHLGGDEVPKDEWKKCPACAARMKAKKLTDYEQLQADFSSQLAEYAAGKGKKTIFWNESLSSGRLRGDDLIQYWAEMAPGPSYAFPAAADGHRFILSNEDKFYCTDSYALPPLRATLMYEPNLKGNPIPDKCVEGIEMAMWTEWTVREEDIERSMYPRMLAVAECCWTRRKNPEEFMDRAKNFLETDGLNVLKPEDWEQATVNGSRALGKIAESLLSMGARYAQLAAAEAEDGGEAGFVGAVVPDNGADYDPSAMAYGYVRSKMAGIYSEEDIAYVTQVILQQLSAR